MPLAINLKKQSEQNGERLRDSNKTEILSVNILRGQKRRAQQVDRMGMDLSSVLVVSY